MVHQVAEVTNDMEKVNIKAEKKEKKAKGGASNDLELVPKAEYVDYRIQMFERLKKEYDEKISAKPREPISITLPDGSIKEGTSWETTPLDVAKMISSGLAQKVFIAKVDGILYDLERPLENSCSLELLDFNSDDGKQVFWHSSAHILGEACEKRYGCHLCIGPPLEEGFYYEMGMEHSVGQDDFSPLENLAKNIIKEKQPFERLEVSKEDLLEMFKHNSFKIRLINSKIPDGSVTTVYRCGPLIDLCRGPHVPHTGRVKAFMVTKNSSSYFLGDSNNESLQRIYGISFPDAKQLTEYKQFLEEASKRDHRKIGKDQELFFFNEMSPGSCFFLPHGARIYNKLVELQRDEYRKRGFEEVISPNIYNNKLWITSGHWQNYKENMFSFDVEKETYGLKPMNCPGHCMIFSSRSRSYLELPIRMADFGVLHRNEFSGALSGLTRVRRFQQDDAHIFCTLDQLKQEMEGALDFMKCVYGRFGFEFSLKLSTRPEKYLGDIEVWNHAEKVLENALNDFVGSSWELNPGDGAFYGPKIDVIVHDALRRKHQCATIQLDFQLPERFDLKYRTKEQNRDDPSKDYKRPVIIHRAIYGSVERFIAILTEHYGGKWPLWVSPRQIQVIPIAASFNEYAAKIRNKCFEAGFYCDVDLSDNTLKKKIRNAEIGQYNYVFVVGGAEEDSYSVNVRCRDDPESKTKGEVHPFETVLSQLISLRDNFASQSVLN